MTSAFEVKPTFHAMLDLETVGVGPNAAIIQVGLVLFNPLVLGMPVMPDGYSVEWNVNLMSSLLHGGQMDLKTFKWWQDKKPEHHDAVTRNSVTISEVLTGVDEFFKTHQPRRIWCHGATFDCPILAGYYYNAQREPPWGYSDVRDTRTLFELAADMTDWKKPDRGPVAHTGVADCCNQIMDVQEALAALRFVTNAAYAK